MEGGMPTQRVRESQRGRSGKASVLFLVRKKQSSGGANSGAAAKDGGRRIWATQATAQALLVLLWSRDEAAMAGGRQEARAMAFDGTGEAVRLDGKQERMDPTNSDDEKIPAAAACSCGKREREARVSGEERKEKKDARRVRGRKGRPCWSSFCQVRAEGGASPAVALVHGGRWSRSRGSGKKGSRRRLIRRGSERQR